MHSQQLWAASNTSPIITNKKLQDEWGINTNGRKDSKKGFEPKIPYRPRTRWVDMVQWYFTTAGNEGGAKLQIGMNGGVLWGRLRPGMGCSTIHWAAPPYMDGWNKKLQYPPYTSNAYSNVRKHSLPLWFHHISNRSKPKADRNKTANSQQSLREMLQYSEFLRECLHVQRKGKINHSTLCQANCIVKSKRSEQLEQISITLGNGHVTLESKRTQSKIRMNGIQ
jgi:hypothetical protein